MESMDTSAPVSGDNGATGAGTDAKVVGANDKTAHDKSAAPATERCTACHTELMTVSAYQRHLSGAKHKKTLKQQGLLAKVAAISDLVETTLENTKGYQCKLCRIFLHSADVALSHVQGTRHNLRRQGGDVSVHKPGYGAGGRGVAKTYPIQSVLTSYNSNNSCGVAGMGASVQRYSTGAVNKTVKPAGDSSAGAGGATLFRCDLCNCTSNSMSQLAAHTQGARHKQNAQGTATNGGAGAGGGGGVSSLPYGISRTESSGELCCRLCNVVTNSSVQLEQHLQSQRHRLAGRGECVGGVARSSLSLPGGVGRGRKPYQRYSGVGRGGGGVLTSPWSAPYDGSGLAAAAAVVAANNYGGAAGQTAPTAGHAVSGAGGPGASGYTAGMVSPYVSMAGYSQQAAVAAAAAADYGAGTTPGAAAPAHGQYGTLAQYGAGSAAAAAAAANYSANYSSNQFDVANSYNRNFYLAKQPPPPPPQKAFKTSNYV